MNTYIPDRGDIAWLDFSPQAGREQSGRRPALIITVQRYNALSGLALVCPVTSKRKGYAFEVALPPGMQTQGVVIADHVRSSSWVERHAVYKERAPSEILDEVLARLATLLEF